MLYATPVDWSVRPGPTGGCSTSTVVAILVGNAAFMVGSAGSPLPLPTFVYRRRPSPSYSTLRVSTTSGAPCNRQAPSPVNPRPPLPPPTPRPPLTPRRHARSPTSTPLPGQADKLSKGSGVIALPTMVHWSPGGKGREVLFFTVRPVYDAAVYDVVRVRAEGYKPAHQYRVEFLLWEFVKEG